MAGVALPQYGTHARADRVAGFARDAEEAGFDSFWVGDRALTSVAPGDLYPGHTPRGTRRRTRTPGSTGPSSTR
ncbi:hypothetical protein HHL19_24775 [Streptomyces sp. R302]|uniref:hypothetical protein n=1 Tax=unclassified Streptomyces TaxID=2593676 RepID=UPI00145F9E64|nr:MULTISPECIES: hypothetical protein [unclassified Streptomyces]NML54517.1 hypothetical protein [Streptomyces sp. R301]NML81779.1 hypothetical protein [Streptomyces sp. R302]